MSTSPVKRTRSLSPKKQPVPSDSPLPDETGDDHFDLNKDEPSGTKKKIRFDAAADVLEIDPNGESKVDEFGILSGPRIYKVPVFILPHLSPTRLYMRTMDVAREVNIKKMIMPRFLANAQDREYMDANNLVPPQMKHRDLWLSTARAMYKKFGYKLIQGGRIGRDDYVTTAELPEDAYTDEMRPDTTKMTDFENLKHIPAYSTGDQVMLRAIQSAAQFNRQIQGFRPKSFIDHHTETEQVPALTQPTKVSFQINQNSKHKDKGVFECESRIVMPQDHEYTDPQWEVIHTEPTKYPIAIMTGQHQNSISIYPTNGYLQGTTDILKVTAASLTAHLSFIPPPIQEEIVVTKKRDLNVTYVCGEVTKTGTICQKHVANPGDKCMYHGRRHSEGDEDEDGDVEMEGSECCHCNKVVAEDKKKNFGTNLRLHCSVCQTRHHPACLDFQDKVLVCKVQTYAWACNSCKLCGVCESEGDDDTILFCDTCDRGTHMECLTPPLETLPEGVWLCPLCGVCRGCKTTEETVTNWKHMVVKPTASEEDPDCVGNYLTTYCSACYVHFKEGRYCPLCLEIYNEDEDDLAMASCDVCERWIHVDCDPSLTKSAYTQLTNNKKSVYTCVLCDPPALTKFLAQKRKENEYLKVCFCHHLMMILFGVFHFSVD